MNGTRPQGQDEDAGGHATGQTRVAERPTEDGPIPRLQPVHDARLPLFGVLPERQRRQDGHQRQRENQGADQREDDRERHRPEHLSLDTLERQDGQVDDDDDQHGKEDRPRDLLARLPDDLLA